MQASVNRYSNELESIKRHLLAQDGCNANRMAAEHSSLKCKCGGKLFTYFKQTRSSDEPVTQYFKCDTCSFGKRVDG